MFKFYLSLIWIEDEGEVPGLIDDNPIEDDNDGEDSDGSDYSRKRKKSDDEDFDDRLEDEDYDLLEENLGVKVERVYIIAKKKIFHIISQFFNMILFF